MFTDFSAAQNEQRRLQKKMERKKCLTFLYLQSTLTLILFETVGGTLFDAATTKNRERHMQIENEREK